MISAEHVDSSANLEVYGNSAMINAIANQTPAEPQPRPMSIAPKFDNLQENEQRACTVVYEYDAAHNDELTLRVGNPVVVLEASDDGWVRG